MKGLSRVVAAVVLGLSVTLATGCTGGTPAPDSSSAPVAVGSPLVTAASPAATPSAAPTPTLGVTLLPVTLPGPVSRLVALGDGDRVLLLGGYTGTTTTADVLSLAPATGTTGVVTQLVQATHDAGGAVLGGRAVVVGRRDQGLHHRCAGARLERRC